MISEPIMVIYHIMLCSEKSLDRLRHTNKTAEVAFWLLRHPMCGKKDVVDLMIRVENGSTSKSEAIFGV